MIKKVTTSNPNKLKEAREKLSVREREYMIQVGIPTKGCRLGKCVFCNYGKLDILPINETVSYLREVLNNMNNNITTLILDAIGSILDFDEIPKSHFLVICKEIAKYKQIKTIIFETHYTTINDNICKELITLFPDKELELEIGLETINEQSMNIINKKIDLNLFLEKVNIAHKYDIKIEANIFVGIPFLTIADRIKDCVETVNWAYYNNIDYVVLFPCNLKKGTYLKKLFEENRYTRVSHVEILEILEYFNEKVLEKISFSWTGDWFQYDEKGTLINEVPAVYPNEDILNPIEYVNLRNNWDRFYKNWCVAKTGIRKMELRRIMRALLDTVKKPKET